MNAISYINGDNEITDFPPCSARPLAAFVQWCNDSLAGPDDYLSPDDSLMVLELGWQTVGTADVSDAVIHAWVAGLLASPRWGVFQYANGTAIKAISDIAELHRRVACGDPPLIAAWDNANRAAQAAACAINPTLTAAGLSAVRAARASLAPLHGERKASLDAVTGNALLAHTLAPEATDSVRAVVLTRHAIRSWRCLAGLDKPGDISSAMVETARSAILER